MEKKVNKKYRKVAGLPHKDIKDFYEMYINTNDDDDIVHWLEFRKILYSFNRYFFDRIVDGEEISFPFNLGAMVIVGRKCVPKIDENGNIKGLPPDFGATRKLWNSDPKAKAEKRIIYYENTETDGYVYRCLWNKLKGSYKYINLYALITSKPNRTKIFKAVKSGKRYKDKIPVNFKSRKGFDKEKNYDTQSNIQK